jgi:transposase
MGVIEKKINLLLERLFSMVKVGLERKLAVKACKQLSATQKAYIRGLVGAKNSLRVTAKLAGVTLRTVQRCLANFEKLGNDDRQAGSGRPRKTTKNDDRKIILAVKRNRLITSEQLLRENPDFDVSVKTIRRRITESGEFNSYWVINKPFISKKNRAIRVKWCKERLHWTVEQWMRVIWTDESPFVLRYNGRRRVWRRHNERYKPFAMKGTVKHDAKLMVWGCFAGHGVGNLYRVEGILESEQYKQILRTQFKPSAQRLFGGRNYTFQQDNDPKHTSRATRAYMDWLGLDPEEWPSQSPDLNPIENLWSYLDWRLRDRHCGSLEELWAALQEGWNSIPVDYLTKLVESMPRRLQAVIDAKGYPTKY